MVGQAKRYEAQLENRCSHINVIDGDGLGQTVNELFRCRPTRKHKRHWLCFFVHITREIGVRASPRHTPACMHATLIVEGGFCHGPLHLYLQCLGRRSPLPP